MTFIRPPAAAGSFYPAEPDRLARELDKFLSEADNAPAGAAAPKAIIGPHAGYAYSGAVAARGFSRPPPARQLQGPGGPPRPGLGPPARRRGTGRRPHRHAAPPADGGHAGRRL